MTHLAPLRLALSVLIIVTNALPVETGELIGYLEWAEPVIQEAGAKFYMMRVCPFYQSWN